MQQEREVSDEPIRSTKGNRGKGTADSWAGRCRFAMRAEDSLREPQLQVCTGREAFLVVPDIQTQGPNANGTRAARNAGGG
jgi:hypothetical protein